MNFILVLTGGGIEVIKDLKTGEYSHIIDDRSNRQEYVSFRMGNKKPTSGCEVTIFHFNTKPFLCLSGFAACLGNIREVDYKPRLLIVRIKRALSSSTEKAVQMACT